MTAVRKPTKPWDCEWAAELAGDALKYLGRNYPEFLENLRALDQRGGGAPGGHARRSGWIPRGPQKLLQGRSRCGVGDT